MRVDPLLSQVVVALAETEQFMLRAPDEAWRVVEGRVLVYLALSDAFGVAGPPRYVATCREGQALIGGSASHAETGLSVSVMVVAGERARLERADPAGGIAMSAVEARDWALTLCRDLVRRAPEGSVQTSQQRDVISAPAGGRFGIRGTELALVSLTRGEATLCGFSDAVWTPEAGPAALNSASWLVAGPEGADARLVAEDAEALAPDASRRTTRLWIAASFEAMRIERVLERARLASAETRREAERNRAVDALRFVDDDAGRIEPRPNDPLEAALEQIGRELDVTFDMRPLANLRRPMAERLARAAELSFARCRRVDLSGPWITGDAGLILAFTKGGLPRVFTPRARRFNMALDYVVTLPEQGLRRKATLADLSDLEETGHVFVAGLPEVAGKDGKVDHWRLSAFAVKPQIPDMKQVMLLMLASMALGMLTPVGHFIIIDKVIPNDERELLVGIGIAVAVIGLCTFAFGMAQAFVNLRVQTKMFTRMQSSIIDRMLRLPTRFFRSAPTGELLKRALMITDVSVGMVSTISGAVSAVIGTMMMLALAFYYSATLAWVAVIVALLSAAVTVTSSYLMRQRNIDIQLVSGRTLGYLMQVIAGVSKIQSARAEERAFAGWARGKGEALRMAYANERLQHNAGMLSTAIQTGATIALFYIAGRMVLQSEAMIAMDPLATPLLTIGVFFAFQRAFTSIIQFVAQFFTSFVAAHEQILKRELVRPFLETPMEQRRNRLDPGALQGRIELRGVSFRYTDEGPLVLDGVDMDADDGEFVAIVGPSGAGKSTIVSLILGFETPTAGAVLIDGRGVDMLEMGAVRRQIGVVLQHDRIASGSLYQAIAGASAISIDQAWNAARDAGLEADIKAMPMGMFSLVPEGGGTLSGGQRQRLSIARALAQDPRVMLFDEATSALDNRSQAIVGESMRRRRVTRIVIAHRLSTIAGADRVFVLSRGRVVEHGTPEALRAAGGLFARLAQNQEV